MKSAVEKQREILEEAVSVDDHIRKRVLLNQVVDLGPDTPYGLYAQGGLAGLENIDEMIGKLKEAIRLQPDFPLAHNDLGLAYLIYKADFQEAEKEFREALKQNPAVPLFHNNLGAALYYQGRLAEAETAYKKAIELSPEFALPHHNLGILYYYGLDLDNEAEKEFRQAVRFAPEFASAHAHLGLILGDKEEFDDAEEELIEAIELDSDLWLAHLGLGCLYAEKANLLEDEILYEEAVDHLDHALEKNLSDQTIEKAPIQNVIFGLRGYVKWKLGRYNEAKADLTRAVQFDPKDLTNKRNLKRIKKFLREKRIPFITSVLTVILGVISLLAFTGSFWLFHLGLLREERFVLMAISFFVLTLVCLYLPCITRLRIGAIELEKVSTKSFSPPPALEK